MYRNNMSLIYTSLQTCFILEFNVVVEALKVVNVINLYIGIIFRENGKMHLTCFD